MADNISVSYISLSDGQNHPIEDINAFDNVEYDSQTKRINFKHGNTVLKYIDATDFIKDGMVDNVQIVTPESGDNAGLVCLLVTFNTDAGHDDIELPLTSIFNPNNYYTKTQIDQSVVKYSTAQNLNDAHKSQARQNIGAGTLTGVSFNGTSASVSNGVVTINETDPVFSSSAASIIVAEDLTYWNDKSDITSIMMNGSAVNLSSTGSGHQVTADLGTVITSHASHKLTATNGTASSVSQGTEITFVESISGTSTATSGDLSVSTTRKKVTIPTAVTESTITGWGFTKNAGTLTSETDPIFSASVAASISASDIANWNSKTSNTGTLTGVKFNGTDASVSNGVASISVSIPAEVTEATVSSWGFTKNSGTLTSHATHKLNIGSATATAAANNTITYVESLTGTTTATSGDLTITPTLKTITVPTAVTEATVAGWGFTKNVGTLTSESDPIFSASVAASISASDIANWNSKTSNTGTVTGSSLTADKVVLGNGGTAIKNSTYGISTTAPASGSDDTTLPTSKAVYSAITTALTSVLKYKGTIGTGGTVTSLPATHSVGDVYVVSVSGTYAGEACEVGDYILCKTAGTSANNAHWDVINGENQVDNKSASLASAGSSATIATVDGTDITISTPASWTGVDKIGTLTGVSFNGTAASISNGIASISANVLPSVSASDNGKILQVSSGSWSLVTPISVYTSSSAPNNNNGIDGDLYIQTS